MEDDKKFEEALIAEEESLRDRINEIRKELRAIELKRVSLDRFKYKFIMYDDGDTKTYMYVKRICVDNLHYTNFDFHYILQGYSLDGEFTEYDDATWMNWDYMGELYLYGYQPGFENKVSSIKIISKDEFESKFNEYVDKMKELHTKKMKKLTE